MSIVRRACRATACSIKRAITEDRRVVSLPGRSGPREVAADEMLVAVLSEIGKRASAARAVADCGTPGMPDESKVARLTQVDSAVVMFQPKGFEGARPEVLRWLSAGARVHNVDWTINGSGGISYAVYGTVLACAPCP